MFSYRLSRVARYSMAILAVSLAAFARTWFAGLLVNHPFVPFFFATLFVVVFGGAGPGIVATMGSALLVTYQFLEPIGSLRVAAGDDRVRLLIFISIGVIMSVVAARIRRSREAQIEAATLRTQQASIEALKRSEHALKDADLRKDQFLATLAHELRNPLAAIRSATYALSQEGPMETKEKRERKAISIVDRQVDYLIRLVDDLLDVSRITTGNIKLRIERLDLGEVLRSSIETANPEIDLGEHDVEVDVATGLVVEGDLVRLTQIFANLLTNAAKYTDRGGIISVVAERAEGHAIVTVRDNGIGIPQEMLPRVFDLFARVDCSGTREQNGLGIGLGLVKKLVELHGGVVEAHSEGTGRGSAFIVRLPLAK